MATMNISLTDDMKAAIDEQVERRGYVSTSEYVRELVRKDLELAHVRKLLLEGAASTALDADDDFWSTLHEEIERRTGG